MDDFNHQILEKTAHRPWPMPDTPWILTQTWHDLLFAHWPVDADSLRSRVPAAFELDLFAGQAWVGVVPFRMSNVAARGAPRVPWASEFPELNVRTYVRVRDKPGVYFFSLDAANLLAVVVARLLVHLPYFRAEMMVDKRVELIYYSSRRRSGPLGVTPASESSARFVGHYRPVGEARTPREGTLEYFLTERYCLYTDSARGLEQGRGLKTPAPQGSKTPPPQAYRLDIHHPPWLLQPAEATIVENTMAEAAGICLPSAPPLLHFSRRQDAVAWGLTRLDSVPSPVMDDPDDMRREFPKRDP